MSRAPRRSATHAPSPAAARDETARRAAPGGPGPTAPGPPSLPADFGLVLDPATRVRHHGRVLLGGSPRRILRLSTAGAALVGRLRDGAPVGTAGGALGRRLVATGAAHPVPPAGGADVDGVTVVIPVRDRPAELARCLRALNGYPRVLVVDDGSTDDGTVRELAAASGADVLRLPSSAGPAAARNAALRAVETPLVAFLDSDCVVPVDWLERLAPQLADPALAAVAPRVRGRTPGASTAERWAAARSPLDLGRRPGPVAPGGRLGYVPTAALLVRRAAIAGGFDEALRYGEDVDLVWRLHDAGWAVRYEPAVVVDHDEPTAWRAFLARRYRYGTSAGPLALRHGGRLAPVVVAPRPAVAAALLLAGRPRTAAVVVGAEALRLGRRLRAPGVPPWLGPQVALRGTLQTLDGAARTGAMLAPVPLLLLAAARPGARRAVLGPLLGAPLVRWAQARTTGTTGGLGPLRWTAASLADDAAYGAGVWAGALRTRSPRALLPAVGR